MPGRACISPPPIPFRVCVFCARESPGPPHYVHSTGVQEMSLADIHHLAPPVLNSPGTVLILFKSRCETGV